MPLSEVLFSVDSCRYPSSTIRLRWIVTNVDRTDVDSVSVKPSDDFSAATFRRKRTTRSEWGMMWGIFWIRNIAAFLEIMQFVSLGFPWVNCLEFDNGGLVLGFSSKSIYLLSETSNLYGRMNTQKYIQPKSTRTALVFCLEKFETDKVWKWFLPSFVHFCDEGRSFALLDQPVIRLRVRSPVVSPVKTVYNLV